MAPDSMTNKYVYAFADGDGHDKKLLGGKGANLCQMTQIGIKAAGRPDGIRERGNS